VRRRVATREQAPGSQHQEQNEYLHVSNQEHFWTFIGLRSAYKINQHETPEYGHGREQYEGHNPKPHVPLNLVRTYKTRLSNQQKDPQNKDRAMNVDKPVGQLRTYHSRQEVTSAVTTIARTRSVIAGKNTSSARTLGARAAIVAIKVST
jgi:hypothetical protein